MLLITPYTDLLKYGTNSKKYMLNYQILQFIVVKYDNFRSFIIKFNNYLLLYLVIPTKSRIFAVTKTNNN